MTALSSQGAAVTRAWLWHQGPLNLGLAPFHRGVMDDGDSFQPAYIQTSHDLKAWLLLLLENKRPQRKKKFPLKAVRAKSVYFFHKTNLEFVFLHSWKHRSKGYTGWWVSANTGDLGLDRVEWGSWKYTLCPEQWADAWLSAGIPGSYMQQEFFTGSLGKRQMKTCCISLGHGVLGVWVGQVTIHSAKPSCMFTDT